MSGQAAMTHDEYLNEHVRGVLESLVEVLVVERPDDCARFSAEWLRTWHAERTGGGGAADAKPQDPQLQELRAERDALVRERDALLGNLRSTTLAAAQGEAVAVEEEDPEEQAKINRMKEGDRRQGVSAPAISEDRMKAWVKPVYEKPLEAKETIRKFIASNDKLGVLFGHLTDSSINDVIDAMEPRTVAAGSDLITQGEEGDNFYIVDDGQFDIFVKRGDAPPGKVMECGPGAMFGELALMYNARRAATVRATSDAKVWGLDRESFQMMLATAENTKLSQWEEFLSNIELFRQMTKYEITQLSDLLESELFDGGEDIMKQGDEGAAFYILEDGEAKAYISGEQGEVEVKHYSAPGDFFGEVALITNAPRRATVRACGTGCTVLAVKTEDFDKVLGPIRKVLEKNIDLYPNYAEILKAAGKAAEAEGAAPGSPGPAEAAPPSAEE